MSELRLRFTQGHRRDRVPIPWLVALATGSQSLLQAVDAGMQGSRARFVMWLVGGLATAVLFGAAERPKQLGVES